MRIEQLEYFDSLVKNKTIQSVSEKYYTSPQVVSKAIKQLENELNTELFIRSKKGLLLTDSGRDIYPFVEQILKNYNYIKFNYIENNSASIKINILASYGTDMFLSLLLENHFFDNFSNIGINILPVKTVDEIITQSNPYDIILTIVREQEIERFYNNFFISDEYYIHELLKDYHKVWVKSNSQYAKKEKFSIDEIKDLPLIEYAKHENSFEETYGIQIDCLNKVNDIGLAIELLKKNKGILLAPEFIIDSHLAISERNNLISIPLEKNFNIYILIFEKKKSKVRGIVDKIKHF